MTFSNGISKYLEQQLNKEGNEHPSMKCNITLS